MQKKNSNAFHDTGIEEIRDKRNIIKHNEGNLLEAYSQHHINRQNFKTVLLNREQDKVVYCHISIQCSPFNFRPVRQLKEIKGIQFEKEEGQVSLFVYDMVIYISDPKNSIRNVLHSAK